MSRQILNVTADSGANLKLLRKLEKEGYIKTYFINLENTKDSKRSDYAEPAFFMIGVSMLGGGDVLAPGSASDADDDLIKIIGRNHYEDRRHLLGHYELGNDIFVSEDKDDILSHKEELESIGIKVMSTRELCLMLGVDYE